MLQEYIQKPPHLPHNNAHEGQPTDKDVVGQLTTTTEGRVAEIMVEELLQNVRHLHQGQSEASQAYGQTFNDVEAVGFKNVHPRHLLELAQRGFNAQVIHHSNRVYIRQQAGAMYGALNFEQTARLLHYMTSNLRSRNNGQDMELIWLAEARVFVQTFMEQCRTKLQSAGWATRKINLLTTTSTALAALEEIEEVKKASAIAD